MSLVSEALRKARAEATGDAARRHGVVLHNTVLLGPPSRRFVGGWVVAALVAAAAVAGAGAAWWLVAGRPPGGTVREARAPAAPAAPAPPPASALAPADARPTPTPSAIPTPTVTPAPAATRAPAARPTAASAPAREAEPEPKGAGEVPAGELPVSNVSEPAPREEPQAPPVPRTREAAPPPATPHAHRAGSRDGRVERSFGIDADLGYAKLHLDYIVYRPKAPFAGINGQQVIIGSVVGGFTVEDITADAVLLRDAKGPLELRVH